MEVSNIPLLLVIDSLLIVVDIFLVLLFDKLLYISELFLLIGLSGGFDIFMMFASCDFLVLIILSFNDCFGEGLGCIKDFLWVFNRDFVEGSLFMGFKFD